MVSTYLARFMREKLSDLEQIILDENRRTRFQFISVYAVLGIVSFFMTVVNIITSKGFLTIATAGFALLCLIGILLSTWSERGMKLASVFFEVEIIVLFSFFIISGNPEGFSALWTIMLPSMGMLLFGRRHGSVLSGIMFVILIFLLWLPSGQALLRYAYTSTFLMRFPMLYMAFYLMGLLLETVRSITFRNFTFLSSHDFLTGALNRRGFESLVRSAITEGPGEEISFMIFDLDFFKKVNDTYGHFTGDAVLKQSAVALASLTGMPLCRWGGEEFAVVDANGVMTRERASNIISAFSDFRIVVDGQEIPLTVSMGCVRVPRSAALTADWLCIQADKCLYDAKESGRNRAVFAYVGDPEL